jgi:hypothetical protein
MSSTLSFHDKIKSKEISSMSDSLLDQFMEARHYLNENLESMIVTYLCGLWDPLIEFVILKELNTIIDTDLRKLFPSLPVHAIPKYAYRVFRDEPNEKEENVDVEVEISIQQYLNLERGLMFLGNLCREDSTAFDLYCTPYYDGLNNFLFYARYGHTEDNCFTGSAEARSEYHLGIITPLSVAYGMAVHDGYINE